MANCMASCSAAKVSFYLRKCTIEYGGEREAISLFFFFCFFLSLQPQKGQEPASSVMLNQLMKTLLMHEVVAPLF